MLPGSLALNRSLDSIKSPVSFNCLILGNSSCVTSFYLFLLHNLCSRGRGKVYKMRLVSLQALPPSVDSVETPQPTSKNVGSDTKHWWWERRWKDREATLEIFLLPCALKCLPLYLWADYKFHADNLIYSHRCSDCPGA